MNTKTTAPRSKYLNMISTLIFDNLTGAFFPLPKSGHIFIRQSLLSTQQVVLRVLQLHALAAVIYTLRF